MADEDQLRILKQGVAAWNDWRRQVNYVAVDLRQADLSQADLREVDLREVDFGGQADLSGAHLNRAHLIKANLREAHLIRTHLSEADLSEADLSEADLFEADLFEANLNKANLNKANLIQAHLIGANLREANFSGAHLNGASLKSATLVETDFTDADLTGCRVYGASAWRLKLSGNTKQRNLIITPENEPEITTEDIEIAQFLYLLIHNEKLRKVIDTITSKVVLILGRFSEERKVVLDAVRDALRKRDLLPVIFDFAIPASRDVTETVKVLAGLARFVIADITDATEVRVELHNIVRDFPSLAVQPILLRGQPEFVSVQHLRRFHWLLPSFEYDNMEHLLANLDNRVVAPADAKLRDLQRPQPPAPDAA